MSILESLQRASGGAIVDQEGAISLAEILERAGCAASALRGNKRIAVVARPGRDFVVEVLAAMWSGATAVVLSPLHPASELALACDRARVDVVVAHRGLDVVLPRPLLLLDGIRGTTPPPLPDPNSDALLLFTSGTTATPKGARLTHRNLDHHSAVVREAWQWSREDRLVHALPLHHLHGLGTALFTSLSAGATCELLPRFDPQLVIDAEATLWMAVPTMIARVLAAPGVNKLKRLRLVTNGSAALPRVLGDRFSSVVGLRPLERYGMTECGVVTTQSLERRTEGSCGRAVPGMDVRIVEGEIEVRGAGVFAGYDDPMHDTFREGWFRTGDAGELNSRGELFVHGRISVDVLKSAGYKLSALEIEAAIRDCPGVEDVAVVGVPDEEWGDRVTAVIVGAVDLEEVRAELQDRLAPYKIPKTFEVRETLPRNSIGKVLKSVLIAEFAKGR